ncbi:SDR family NAD(P)-dependent oxidoreductase [soil metagenome]
MKYLVTGGAGFIGSHLSERLLARGDQVTVLDDLSTGAMSNVAHLEGKPGFSMRIGSALDSLVVRELVDRTDATIHLAAAVGVRLIVERPVHTIETNVRATEVVLDAASRKQRPVMIASTSEVYGKSTKFPFSEEDDLCLGATSRSRWAYACSKALDEWLGLAYWSEKQVPVTVVRFFNTVGPRQTGRYGMVLPNFVRQAMSGQPITVYGDGRQSRCFGHVKDAVEAITRLMATPASVGQVFNIGTDEEISVLGLAERVRDAVGSSSPIEMVAYADAYSAGFEDMFRRVPDLTKLQRTIDFRPRTTLDEIIRDIIEYYRVHGD